MLIRCTTPQGRDAYVAIELRYSEAPAGIASPGRPRYDTLSRSAGVFRDPDAPALCHAPIEQFWHEQLLVTAMLERGHYHDGRLIVIAPALNAECQAAIARYRTELVSDELGRSRRDALPGGDLEDDLTSAVGAAGADTIAASVTERYLDFEPVHRALAQTFQHHPPRPEHHAQHHNTHRECAARWTPADLRSDAMSAAATDIPAHATPQSQS